MAGLANFIRYTIITVGIIATIFSFGLGTAIAAGFAHPDSGAWQFSNSANIRVTLKILTIYTVIGSAWSIIIGLPIMITASFVMVYLQKSTRFISLALLSCCVLSGVAGYIVASPNFLAKQGFVSTSRQRNASSFLRPVLQKNAMPQWAQAG